MRIREGCTQKREDKYDILPEGGGGEGGYLIS